MPTDIADHPDAPDLEELGEFLIEPIPADEIEGRRAAGERLAEVDLLDRDDLDVYVELDEPPTEGSLDDVGTALYRLVQLFGTPQLPEYRAGDDISHRTDATFKYLFRVRRGVSEPGEDADDEWLITVYDRHVDIGVGLAEWRDDDGGVALDEDRAIASLALVHNVASEPVECVYEDKWY